MSVSSTLPRKVAETGPILVLTTAAKPLSPVFSSDSQPGMQDLSTSGSFKSAQTFGLSAGKVTSPVIVMAIDVSFLRGLDPSAVRPPPARFESRVALLPAFRIARQRSRRRCSLTRLATMPDLYPRRYFVRNSSEQLCEVEVFIWILRVTYNTRAFPEPAVSPTPWPRPDH